MIRKTFATATLALLLVTPPLWAMNGGGGHGHGGGGTAGSSDYSDDSSHMSGSHGSGHRGARDQRVGGQRHHGDVENQQNGNRRLDSDHHTTSGHVEGMN